MRLGICTSFQNAPALTGGVDFIEESVQRVLVGEADDAAFAHATAGAAACGLPLAVANCFLPAHLKCTGPAVDLEKLLAYTRVVMARAARLGIRTIVFGSGGARQLPAGVTARAAVAPFARLLAGLAPLAQAHGVTLALEPLNSRECNFINSLRDGAEIVALVNHPHVRLLADLYHLRRDGEAAGELGRYGQFLHHVHVAEVEKRTAPGVAGDDFRPYLRALKQAGYAGDLALECAWGPDLAGEAPTALAALRTQLADAGW
jgi:sugar phosphate isomerase/epimerase